MALTATAQSALHERSWDEEIVPALRKRLEVESRTLANRMSVASLTTSTADDPKDGSTWPSNNSTASGKPSSSSNSHSSHRPMTAQPSSTSLRPSNIPRPSFQSSRPSFPRSDSSHTNSNGKRSVTPSGSAHTATPRKPAKRSRALSTPYPVDRTVSPTPAPIGQTQLHQSSGTILNGSSLPTPASSRSNSPYTQATGPSAKPSRIPRPGFSNSSSNLLNASSPDYAYQHQNQRALAPSPTPSTSTDINLPGSVNSRTHARILNEQAPFPASSSTSQVDVEEPESRASGEEERPYEHWYRGEVSRNGGVGELRIGKRKEMLDIANFGHSPRPVSAISMLAERGVRKRAESMSARESFYLDDERAVTERVLDEMPLTDPEDEDYISIAEGSTDRHQQLPTPTSREPPPLLAPPPANASKQSLQQPRRPTTSTTSKVAPSVRSATAPTPGPSSSTGAGPKKRVNNARGPATPGKKNVPRKPTRSMSSNTTSYPSDDLDGPDGAALADAIPSWSVPTAKNGNWDEVKSFSLKHGVHGATKNHNADAVLL
ncbi:hypothetical protein SISNIDRAFT_456031 [Sistotremastrum niveocremeum HHB9708]|uniref:Uncharacterized protein n=1 Tax=Sistotremastrum niveocremeum HHB9708 TaxID=1314777 RepID=A0A164TDF4_9AGAM|nr:hypothetical protein SISNIDRAFT_456031 [Sistotremastrum niveocremeum HHB9708]